jgi:hypothetical protein
MVGLAELMHYLRGAWRLALLDSAGARHFDNTPAACWRSFQAMILTAPLYALIVADLPAEILAKKGVAHGVAVLGLLYIINWFLFPVVMLGVTAFSGVRAKYYRYIGAYNWAGLFTVLVFFIPSKAAGVGLLPDDLAQFLNFAFLFLSVAYGVVIAKHALEISTALAIGFSIVDLVLYLIMRDIKLALLIVG